MPLPHHVLQADLRGFTFTGSYQAVLPLNFPYVLQADLRGATSDVQVIPGEALPSGYTDLSPHEFQAEQFSYTFS